MSVFHCQRCDRNFIRLADYEKHACLEERDEWMAKTKTSAIDIAVAVLVILNISAMGFSAYVGWHLVASANDAAFKILNAMNARPTPQVTVQCPLPRRSDLPVVTSGTP